MSENNQIQVQLDPHLFYVSNVNVAVAEEDVALVVFSGNSARRYIFSPKHAKRLYLLLQKQIEEYEKGFAPLDTKLIEQTDSGEKPTIGFGKA